MFFEVLYLSGLTGAQWEAGGIGLKLSTVQSPYII